MGLSYQIEQELVSVGASRRPHAAVHCYAKSGDHDNVSTLYYAAGQLLARYRLGKVQTYKFHQTEVVRLAHAGESIVSADAAGNIAIWDIHDSTLVHSFKAHDSPISCMNVSDRFIMTGTEGRLKIWSRSGQELQSIDAGRSISLDASFTNVEGIDLLAVGTTKHIHVYANLHTQPSEDLDANQKVEFVRVATLEGHQDWVTSVTFQSNVLASASQDTYIRLWKITPDFAEETLLQRLSTKSHLVTIPDKPLRINLEAVLTGHEGWVTDLSWHPSEPKLLSSSADKSIILWEVDADSGLWLPARRMGEMGNISGLGLHAPCWGQNCIWASAWTGGWWKWTENVLEGIWKSEPAIYGHVSAVTDVQWSNVGYLLSVSYASPKRSTILSDPVT